MGDLQNNDRGPATLRRVPCRFLVKVELVGFEPTSAQGNHVLSTRLSQPLVFERRQDLGHQSSPYPLKFTYGTGLPSAIPDLPAPLNLRIRDNILGAVSRRTIL